MAGYKNNSVEYLENWMQMIKGNNTTPAVWQNTDTLKTYSFPKSLVKVN
jgi:hypothetical protein